MSNRWILGVCAVLLMGALAACQDESEQVADDPPESRPVEAPSPARTFVFACADLEFTVRIEGETAWLFLPDRTVDLPRIEAASGAKYSDGQTTFWSKGQEASLDHDGRSYTACRNLPARAVWEDAKLRGVDFRAVGNEPGWHLEISADRIVFVTDYGATTLVVPTPEPTAVQDPPHTIWDAEAQDQRLIVKVEPGPCDDTMADNTYATVVTVTMDDLTFHGCGRALH